MLLHFSLFTMPTHFKSINTVSRFWLTDCHLVSHTLLDKNKKKKKIGLLDRYRDNKTQTNGTTKRLQWINNNAFGKHFNETLNRKLTCCCTCGFHQ